MPVIEGLDPTLQQLGTFLFMAAVAIFSAYHYVTGRKPKPETKEFALASQLADMGPVKELVEQAGLLFQQQVRTNIHLEGTATSIREIADMLSAHLADLRAERVEREQDEAIEEKARFLAGQIAEEMAKEMAKAAKPPRRRRAPAKRKPPVQT